MASPSRNSSSFIVEGSPTPTSRKKGPIATSFAKVSNVFTPKKPHSHQPYPIRRKEAEEPPPSRLHRARALSYPDHTLPTLQLDTQPETQSLYTADESMEDVFTTTVTDKDSESVREMPVNMQINHLLLILSEANKLVASLQHVNAIDQARDNPDILNLLNNVVSPITQLPLLSAQEHGNNVREELSSIKTCIETLTEHTAHLKEDMSRAMKWIQDTNARVTNLESRPPAEPSPTTQPIPIPKASSRHNPIPQTSTQTKTTDTKPPTKPSNPTDSHHPTRLVIQFLPDGLHEDSRKDPLEVVTSINTALGKNPKSRHLKVVAAKFNNQGNLIVSTRADQTATDLLKAAPIFTPIINPNNLPISVREDKKWYKIQVDGIPTTAYNLDGTYCTHSPETIHKELVTCNPSYHAALTQIVAPPRWMRNPEELRTTTRSSIVFAVDDETTAKNILHNRALAVFGRHCSLRAYQDRPPVIQCKHCWGWDHKAERCKNPPRCRLCALDHAEADHPDASCALCTPPDENGDQTMEDGTPCLHKLRCTNCINAGLEDTNHSADARRCPSRLEKYGNVRTRTTAPESNPWKTVPQKKGKKPRLPTTALPRAPESNNQFINSFAATFMSGSDSNLNHNPQASQSTTS